MIVTISFILLGLALLPLVYRLIVGPEATDRMLASDAITTVVVGFLALFTWYTRSPVYLNVAMALVIISFISTLALSNYLRHGRVM